MRQEERDLFNRMIAHHLKSLEAYRPEESRLYHHSMYQTTKKELWKLSPNYAKWVKLTANK